MSAGIFKGSINSFAKITRLGYLTMHASLFLEERKIYKDNLLNILFYFLNDKNVITAWNLREREKMECLDFFSAFKYMIGL